ncbi:MAG: YtxH domain-containing protein [Bacteroidia bacterium]
MSSEKGTGAFWAFVAGVAVGTIVGILVAPDKGENTRRKIRERLRSYWDRFRMRDKESPYERAKEMSLSGLQPDEYRRAEQLLLEVENLLGEMQGNR